mgnify:CR=1 FL=1
MYGTLSSASKYANEVAEDLRTAIRYERETRPLQNFGKMPFYTNTNFKWCLVQDHDDPTKTTSKTTKNTAP